MGNSLFKITIFCWLAAPTLHAVAANILLREVSSHQGSVVYLGDVADVSAATTSETQNLVTTPLMAAPAPGTQQFLQARQVRNLLASRGVDVTEVTIAGARTVEVGDAFTTTESAGIEPNTIPSASESKNAVIAAIKKHLLDSTKYGDWEIDVELNATTLGELCKLGLELKASEGRVPWTGTQRFHISGVGTARPMSVVARVHRLQHTVVATRKIERGHLIGAADVEVKLQDAGRSAGEFGSVEKVIGKEALRTIQVNSLIQDTDIRAPLQVQRGETVKVFARGGGVTVSTFAVAQQDGALGDLVQVQTLDKKDRFAARVAGWKQLEVLPTGANAIDFSVSNRMETLNR